MAKAAVVGRQLWIGKVTKWCDHAVIEQIRSEGGTVLADVCKACGLRLAEYGPCHGCGRERRLTKFVLAKRTRYCTPDCYSAAEQAKRDAKREAEQKLRKATAELAKGTR